MTGSVYVFNVDSQQLTLSTNGLQIAAGTIPDWATESGRLRYRPNGVAVPRTLNASDGPGKFFNGRNNLFIAWLDGVFVATVAIDGNAFPLNQDLLLFINRSNWELVSQFGGQVSTGQVTSVNALQDLLANAPS
ncbi:MAG: hypothetical protein AB1586_19375 [Pseudomonadota bacterium]